MITTCRKHVPFGWILIAGLPMVAVRMTEMIGNSSFIFTLKKFIENPALLGLIITIPQVSSFITSPLTSFLSDRIWTRFGRRIPFLAISWIGLAACFIIMPVLPNIWMVAGAYFLFDFFRSLYATYEPLRNEIVPPHQRVRSATYMEWFGSVTQTLFFFVVFGRFDDVAFVSGFPITGEQGMYWSVSLLLVCVTVAILVGVREAEPRGDSRGERLSPRNIIKGLADKDLWPVYTLVFSSALLNAGLGPLGILVYTETFGFSKQDQGTNVVVGGIINMCIIGLLGYWAQRMERIKAYQFLLGFSIVLKLGYYLYIEFVLPDQRATVIEAIVFGEVLSIVMLLKNMIYYPMAYDYVIRNKMGTFQAGSEMIKRLTAIVTVNMVTLFITAYSWLFMPPAGEMTRLMLRDPVPAAAVQQVIDSHTWSDGSGGASFDSARIDVQGFRASGFLDEAGRAWEIRLLNPEAKRLAEERDTLSGERRGLEAGGDPAKAERLAAVKARIEAIEKDLKHRAEEFNRQVVAAFGERIMPDGDGIAQASASGGRVLTFPIVRPLSSTEQERLVATLRAGSPAVVDLGVERDDAGRFLVLGVLEDGTGDAAWGSVVHQAMEVIAPGVLSVTVPATASPAAALHLTLRTVEEPLENQPSPITRVVNGILSWFDADPKPERRIDALARSLRDAARTPHVRAARSPGAERAVDIVALVKPGPAAAGAVPAPLGGVQGRLLSLLGGDARQEPALRDLYERAIPAAGTQRLTVLRPIIAADYASMKYDYMSGYLMMIALACIGMWITIEFCRRERKGLIRKHGLEEAKDLK